MSYSVVLKDCKARGIKIGVVNGKLKVLDSQKKLDAQLLGLIKSHKEELIRVLSQDQSLTKSDFKNARLNDETFAQIQTDNPNFANLYVATPMQVGLLFHGLLDGSGASYTTQNSFTITGHIDVEAMGNAWRQVVQRHDILRTCFVGIGSEQIHQLVQRKVDLPFFIHDWQQYNEAEQQRRFVTLQTSDKSQGFDFSNAPLMRINMVKVGPKHYRFLWSHHHVLLDGWCTPVIFSEVLTYYRALVNKRLAQLPKVTAYELYIGWLLKQDQRKAKSFWQQHLSGVTSATSLDMITPAIDCQPGSNDKVTVKLSQRDSNALSQLAKDLQLTLNVIVQAAWGYLIHSYNNQSDVIFGTTVSGRPPELPGIEQMMGLFINTIPVRVNIDSKMPLTQWLKQIHQENQARNEFGYLSLSDVQKLTSVPKGTALFDTLFIFENQPDEINDEPISQSASDSEFSIESSSTDERTNYKILMTAGPRQRQLFCSAHFQPHISSPEAVKRLMAQMEQILTVIARNGADITIGDLATLGDEETTKLVATFNQTTAQFPQNLCVHQWFEQQVNEQPDSIALINGSEIFTYQQLNSRANQLAHYLIEQGVKPDTLVGILMQRSAELVISILAIIKAGGAYVPLEPTLPAARLEYMQKDSGVMLIITEQQWLDKLPQQSQATLIALDDSQMIKLLAKQSTINPLLTTIGLSANHLAYVIYTSGSTGQPKGVCIEHQALVNRIDWMHKRYPLTVNDKVLQKTPFTFDVSVWEFFWPLAKGAQLVMAKPQGHNDPQYLAQLIQQQQITVLHYVPSMLNMMLLATDWAACDSVKQVFSSGEALGAQTVKQFFATGTKAKLTNLYGPTEAAIDVSYFDCEADSQLNSIPIGKPINNIQLYNLNPQLQLVPIGAIGELHIGGVGLARGYHHRSDLSATQFITNPFSSVPGERLYKTGDLVRWTDDGNLNYIGRKDNQVKLHGLRIELGEIETVLSSCQGVEHCAVIVQQHDQREPYLAAYVALGDNNIDDINEQTLTEEFKSWLGAELPQYMVPNVFTFLPQLPLSANGKLDRKSLPVPKISDAHSDQYRAPRNEAEQTMCQIWQNKLKVSRVGIDDNYFTLGGDSIISIQIAASAKQQSLHFSVGQLLEQQTIAGLMPLVNSHAAVLVPQHMIEGTVPLLPMQQAFFSAQLPEPNHSNQSVLLETPIGFNMSALEQIVTAIYLRHDGLRIRFVVDGVKAQGNHQTLNQTMVDDSLRYYDLSATEPPERQNQMLAQCNIAQASLDIAKGPLFKALYLDCGEEQGRLLLVVHHLVVDAVSMRLLVADFILGWRQLTQQQPVTLQPKTTSIKHWAQALHRYGKSSELTAESHYWAERLTLRVTPLPDALQPKPSGESRGQFSRFQLNQEDTDLLLGQCNIKYQTRINELLLAALLKAYQGWAGGNAIALDMEGHGREALFDDVDVTETVGWFTSVYPLILSVDSDADIATLITGVKQQFREIPYNGVGYGVLQHLVRDEKLSSLGNSKHSSGIVFNYLGRMDNTMDERSEFQLAAEHGGAQSSIKNPPTVRANINGVVVHGKLAFDVVADWQCKDVNLWWDLFEQALRQIITHCCEDD